MIFPEIELQKIIGLDKDNSILFYLKNNFIIFNEYYKKHLVRNALKLKLSKKIITLNGHLFNLALVNRSDFYWYSHSNFSSNKRQEKILSRNIPELHIGWRYPLIHNIFRTLKIEPIASIFIGNNNVKDFKKFNFIDVNKYELSEHNIFSSNKFAGIDYYEHGKRLSYGINFSFFFWKTLLECIL